MEFSACKLNSVYCVIDREALRQLKIVTLFNWDCDPAPGLHPEQAHPGRGPDGLRGMARLPVRA